MTRRFRQEMSRKSEWQLIIGLELHAQLQTTAKLFSAATPRFGQAPNSALDYMDVALPGALPVS